MKTVLSIFFGALLLISFIDLASANLNIKGHVNSVTSPNKRDLYCGLALPPEGEQGGQGQDTEQGQEDSPSPTPSPESEYNSQSDEETTQN